MKVSGTIKAGHGLIFRGFMFRRLAGRGGWVARVANALIAFGLYLLAVWLIYDGWSLPFNPVLAWAGAVLVALVLFRLTGQWAARLAVAGSVARGEPASSAFEYCLTETALELRTPGRLRTVDWTYVSELALHRDCWIFVSGESLFFPRQAFESAGAERAFVGFVVDHLTPEAAARSMAATAVAAGTGKPWAGQV